MVSTLAGRPGVGHSILIRVGYKEGMNRGTHLVCTKELLFCSSGLYRDNVCLTRIPF